MIGMVYISVQGLWSTRLYTMRDCVLSLTEPCNVIVNEIEKLLYAQILREEIMASASSMSCLVVFDPLIG